MTRQEEQNAEAGGSGAGGRRSRIRRPEAQNEEGGGAEGGGSEAGGAVEEGADFRVSAARAHFLFALAPSGVLYMRCSIFSSRRSSRLELQGEKAVRRLTAFV